MISLHSISKYAGIASKCDVNFFQSEEAKKNCPPPSFEHIQKVVQ
jgi:hypothetical protein